MTRPIGRRAALWAPLALPVALGGCSWLENLFQSHKEPVPGKRVDIVASRRGLNVDKSGTLKVVLPPRVTNADWPQAGGNPSHLMGHLSAGDRLTEAWSADIGEGGGYRQKILCQPVADKGLVYTMDSDAVVSAFDMHTGDRLWTADTKSEDDDSTNIGGGLGVNGGVVYAVNGLAWLVALDARTGKEKYRQNVGAPTRSAPTIADGRVFFTTIEDKLLARAADDGRALWSYQGESAATSLLGQPAPAYANGLVVGGFGSGEIAGLRAETGGVAWTDSLASLRGRGNAGDLSAIRGLPVIDEGQVYVVGLGGLLVAIDQRTGRRLWEREVAGEDSVWVVGDWLFVLSLQQQLAAVARADGRVAWVTDLPRYDDEETRSDPITWFGPILVGDRLVLAGTNSQAIAVSPYTGAILGQQDLSGPASLGPIAVDGTVFIVTDDGRLLALR
ncbi:outer membrane protein assembly factor BamB family protein [Acidisphaera rubrifaciens]|uniref:Dehydrogenase with coenzyme pyrrolo-quinoline quinone (PQQ) n=1 Tax=Acidisphaera rubrifaciens HS-AP3 TaxID=1231350 RepID=A0A0D6P322_9PROT|nr:PQQ-binding-like beta-propeller repeat protein [Acidisphaera rubrifaciens]GAN76140.1 dehydrogenase with coenzyme pyrrolo-quinoline quinone (PQQ) [Acidisphaera rubrifaciens HS-AP3]